MTKAYFSCIIYLIADLSLGLIKRSNEIIMYELIQAAENSYYINCPSKIGIVKISDTDVCLIDSGNNRDAGKKAAKILNEKGWKLKAIYNTHSHADHIGGNAYLASQTGCKIYSPGIECAFTRHPILESAYLYGAYPPSDLRHKFLLAEESSAEYLTRDALPEGFELIELPGHFFDMVGIKAPDGAFYIADALSSKETLEKYGIGVIYDVAAYLDTLEKLKTAEAKIFIPSHAEPTENISDLAQYNIDKVHEVADRILSLTASPLSFEDILQKLFDEYSLTMSFEQYALVGSTVRSYLAWLKDTGKISAHADKNKLLWQKYN